MALSPDEVFELELAINEAKENFDELSEWEQEFMVSTEERYNLYKDGTRVSDKQWAIIRRIYDTVAPK